MTSDSTGRKGPGRPPKNPDEPSPSETKRLSRKTLELADNCEKLLYLQTGQQFGEREIYQGAMQHYEIILQLGLMSDEERRVLQRTIKYLATAERGTAWRRLIETIYASLGQAIALSESKTEKKDNDSAEPAQ